MPPSLHFSGAGKKPIQIYTSFIHPQLERLRVSFTVLPRDSTGGMHEILNIIFPSNK